MFGLGLSFKNSRLDLDYKNNNPLISVTWSILERSFAALSAVYLSEVTMLLLEIKFFGRFCAENISQVSIAITLLCMPR